MNITPVIGVSYLIVFPGFERAISHGDLPCMAVGTALFNEETSLAPGRIPPHQEVLSESKSWITRILQRVRTRRANDR